MKSEDVYAIWAPADSPWSPWAKPTLFAQLANIEVIENAAAWTNVDTTAIPAPAADTAVIIELPGAKSMHWGMALAQRGYRPVPLYNGCLYPGIDRSRALLDVAPILDVVMWGTLPLQRIQISASAPPAFLLDADRCRNRFPSPDRFDNRWVVFPQDFPSANLLLSRGIRQVILVQEQEQSQDDLAHVLLRWQEAGIQILNQLSFAAGPPKQISVARPSNFRSLLYRAFALMGLRRNSAGGFGSVVPQPGSGGG
jgi:hypothetical protein